MEYYKNTDNMDGNYFRKDNIKSEFYKPDDGTRWWVIHVENVFSIGVRVATEAFHSEEDARKFMDGFKNNCKVYLIKGKYIEIKEIE